MGFESVMGQDLILKTLKRSLQQEKVAHAYLFSGPVGSGKKMLSTLFAQALNCEDRSDPPCGRCLSCRKTVSGNHPNLTCLTPQGATLKIEQVRDIQESLYYQPGEGRWKVCLIHDADRLTLPAANSLLKILEEPPGQLIFILLSSTPWSLLPTIVSRCSHFNMKPLHEDDMQAIIRERFNLSAEEQNVIVKLAGGNPGQAIEMANRGGWSEKFAEIRALVQEVTSGSGIQLFARAEDVSKRENLDETMDLLFVFYREKWLKCLNAADKNAFSLEKICRAVLQTKDELRSNINRRLALEALFLKMRGVV